MQRPLLTRIRKWVGKKLIESTDCPREPVHKEEYPAPNGWKILSEGGNPTDVPEAVRLRWKPFVCPITEELVEDWVQWADALEPMPEEVGKVFHDILTNRPLRTNSDTTPAKWHIEFDRDRFDYDWFFWLCPTDKEYMFQFGRIIIRISKYRNGCDDWRIPDDVRIVGR